MREQKRNFSMSENTAQKHVSMLNNAIADFDQAITLNPKQQQAKHKCDEATKIRDNLQRALKKLKRKRWFGR